MILGGHLSTKDGFGKLPENATKIGFKTYQFFSKNQMQWKAKPIPEQEANLHKDNIKKFNIQKPAIHASYLLNLGSPEKDKLEKSYEAFIDEIKRAEELGIELLIFHPGAHMGSGEKKALDNIVESMNRAIEETKGYKVNLVVENTAGQGTVVGYSMDHLSFIRDNIEDRSRVGFCIDTCHIYQAGYDISNNFEGVMDEIKTKIGSDYIKAIHLNDSKPPFNKHLDRHEMLGKGTIDRSFFRKIFEVREFSKIPAFLETPEGEEGYQKDIEFLKSLGLEL